jgi:hypothetical protein
MRQKVWSDDLEGMCRLKCTRKCHFNMRVELRSKYSPLSCRATQEYYDGSWLLSDFEIQMVEALNERQDK